MRKRKKKIKKRRDLKKGLRRVRKRCWKELYY